MGDAASTPVTVTTSPVTVDERELAAEIARIADERYVASYTPQRTAGFFGAVVVFAAALCGVTFVPIVRRFLHISPGQMAGAMAVALAAIGTATVCAHRPGGLLGPSHLVAERIETFATAAVAAALIRMSNDTMSVFWLISVMHAFAASTDVRHGRFARAAHGSCLAALALSFAVEGRIGDAAASAFFTLLLLFLARTQQHSAQNAIALQAERNVMRARYEGLLVERERQRIARDLHDGLGAQLASIAWSADALAGTDAGGAEWKDLSARARSMLGELREVVHGLKATDMPIAELSDSLARSCRALAGAHELVVVHGGDAIVRADLCLEITLMVREAVRNAAQHASARRIGVRLDIEGSRLIARIEDDGRSLPKGAVNTSKGGLSHIRHRAEELKGEARFERPAAGGTVIVIVAPL